MNVSRPPRRRLRAPIESGLTTGVDEDPRSAAYKLRRHGLASNDDRSAVDPAPRYAELHCLSNFSFQRGASSARELFERARKLGYSALAITDECSLAGIVRALEAATETGVPLIVGTEVQLADGPKLILLARDQAGYTDICRLITTGRRRSAKGEYRLTCADAKQLGEGVLVLWAAGAAHSSKIGLDIDDGTANGTAAAAAGPAPSPQPSPPTKEPLGEREHVALRSSPLRKDVPCASQQLKPSPPSPLGGEGWVRGPASEVSPSSRLETGPNLEHRTANVTVAAAAGPAPSPQPSPPTMKLSGERGYEASAAKEECAAWLARHFAGRAWIAVELHRGAGDAAELAGLHALGARHGLPLVASGDVHMHVRRRRALQDVMTAIRLGCPVAEAGHALFPNGERHLRRIDDLAALYPPDLLAETLRIAALCTFDLRRLDYRYPHELVPAGLSAIEHLRALAFAGAARLWPHGLPESVRAQVERELALIAELQYEHFFLTVEDIVRWARAQDPPILCQGRGSSANSAVCYCLGITAVSPETGNLLFERFLSKERDEPPDIDVDFEHERREEVIQYVFGKYGRERAALAATVISYRSKSAVRDVGRALGVPDDQLDRLGSLFSRVRSGQPFEAALRERGFDPASRLLQRLFALAGELHGFPRHLSQHVGGFVISEQPLHHLVPVENAAMAERTIIQWDKDDLETMKLLKVDVLALGMLTALRKCLDLLHAHGLWTHPYAGARPMLHDIPQHDDPAVYDMICRADTVGVFQIESRAQMSMLPRLKPCCFYDLVVEVAIVRPGPIQGDMVHPYLRRRQGLEPADYPQSRFERASGSGASQVREALGRTLGVPIFQEQVMKLIQVVAGFTPGEADELRRAMAAWKRRGGLEHFRERIHRGMRERGYEDAYFERIFQQIQGFGEYGFPESHAASFAALAWASSWLKHYHPAAFTCALLNAQPMGFYQPSQLIQDAQRHGVTVLPVDVTVSEWDCTLEFIEPSPPSPLGGEGWTRAEGNAEQVLRRHARERGHPLKAATWIPALAEMTTSSENLEVSSSPTSSADLPFDHGAANPAPSPQSSPSTKMLSEERGHAAQRSRQSPAMALRLGLRQVLGLSEELATRLVAARAAAPFGDVADLTRRARVNAAERARLADAGALRSLSGHRHRARWDSAGAELPAPLLQEAPFAEAHVALRRPSLREDVMTDYATLGLSLRAHPLALVREVLARRRVVPASAALDPANRGRSLRCAGLVTVRQHPGTAKGVTFVTLEDESGQVNVVVWRALAERQHRVLLEATLMAVDGVLEASDGVHHLIARRLYDYSALLPEFAFASRDFH